MAGVQLAVKPSESPERVILGEHVVVRSAPVVRGPSHTRVVAVTLAVATVAPSELLAPSSGKVQELIFLVRVVIQYWVRERVDERLHPDSTDGVEEVARPGRRL